MMRICLLFILTCFCGSLLRGQTVTKKYNLRGVLSEISGMTIWKNRYFAHADGGSPSMLFELDSTGKHIDTTIISSINNDWEDMAANQSHFFIGDFGNNNGTRKNLSILKFTKDSLGETIQQPEVIHFQYADQQDFSSNTFSEFDCEAMIAMQDSIYLFSKSKSTAICRIYSLPVAAGTYTAKVVDTIKPSFWVTGAHFAQNKLWLCGYAPSIAFGLNPFLYTSAMVDGKIQHQTGKTFALNVPGTNQIESMCLHPSGTLLISGEYFNNDSAAVFEVRMPALSAPAPKPTGQGFFPNPSGKKINISNTSANDHYAILNTNGNTLQYGLVNKQGEINVEDLAPGIYALQYFSATGHRSYIFVKN